jgi:phage tail sheath gpL-like
MPINTGVPASEPRPQTFHRFTYLKSGGLTPLAQKVVLMGTMYGVAAGVTGVASTLYDIFSAEDADARFGVGSELALMYRQAEKTFRMQKLGPQIACVGALEPAGGAKATFTLTFTGPAGETKNIILKACGRRYQVGVTKDDTATDMAAAAVAVFDAHAEDLPFTTANVAGVLTATYNHKGVNGNDVKFELVEAPAGVGVAVAAGVAGAGAVDFTACLAAVEGVDIDGFAISNHTNTDVTAVLDHVQLMWSPEEKKWRWGFIADCTSLGSATALAATANDRAVVIASCEGSPSMPFEVATAVCCGVFSRERANAIFNKMNLPVYPPAASVAYNGAEVKAGILAGLTILTPIERGRVVLDDRTKIERLVTTKTLDENNNPFTTCRDIGVPRTGAFLARQLDIKYDEQFGADANPDGALLDEDSANKVGDIVAAVWHAAARDRLITNVDADLGELLINEDEDVAERLDVQTAQTVIVGLHQVAYHHNVKIGGAL